MKKFFSFFDPRVKVTLQVTKRQLMQSSTLINKDFEIKHWIVRREYKNNSPYCFFSLLAISLALASFVIGLSRAVKIGTSNNIKHLTHRLDLFGKMVGFILLASVIAIYFFLLFRKLFMQKGYEEYQYRPYFSKEIKKGEDDLFVNIEVNDQQRMR